MISNSEVSFCIDTLLVETVLGEPKLSKQAGAIGDLLTKVKDYFMAHIDKSHPVASVLKLLAPGFLWTVMQGMGLGKWGFVLGLLADYFHVDVPGMIESLLSKVAPMISGGKQASSQQIDAATDSLTSGSPASDHKVYTSLELLDEARFLRLAVIEYEHQKLRLLKEGADENNIFGIGERPKSSSVFAKIIGWVFKIALASAGLMVAGDAIHAFMGTPSALTGTYQEGVTPTSSPIAPSAPSGPVSTQKKFPLKGDAPLGLSWPATNTPGNIENMIIQFAKDTYSGLDGKESLIRVIPSFQDVKEDIQWFNVHNPGTSVIFIPHKYPTKKSIVDYFIDDVARASA